jgi:hypothetical protein
MAATRFEHEPFSIIQQSFPFQVFSALLVTLQDWTLYGQASEDSVASACFSWWHVRILWHCVGINSVSFLWYLPILPIFSPSLLQRLIQTLHDLSDWRESNWPANANCWNPFFEDPFLQGLGCHQELDAAVLAIFQETNSSAASGSIRNLFEEWAHHGQGANERTLFGMKKILSHTFKIIT